MKSRSRRIVLRPGVTLDLDLQGLWKGRRWIPLQPIPFRLLAYLAQHPNQVIPESRLLAVGWPDEQREDPSDLYHPIYRLRQLLEPYPHRPRWLVLRRRAGYCFNIAHRSTRFGRPTRAP